MAYLPASVAAYEELGASVAITGNAQALSIGKLQAAINRVIEGGRRLPSLSVGGEGIADPRQLAAKAATEVAISGVIGGFTAAAYDSARIITGVSQPSTLTTLAQIDQATSALNAAADSLGFPAGDAVSLAAGIGGKIGNLFGGGGDKPKGISTTVIALGVATIGVLGLVWIKRRKQNPRRRRHRRWR